MSSSGITPTVPGATKPSAPSGQVVQIVSLPDGLKNMARAMRIEGEVVQQNPDGSTRVKTAEGNVDIMIRGRQPQPGQKLEIDVPAGNPPRNVTVRSAPAQPQAPAPSPSSPPPTSNAPPPVTTQPIPQQPVPEDIPQGQTPRPAPLPTTPSVPVQGSPPQTPGTQAPLTTPPLPPTSVEGQTPAPSTPQQPNPSAPQPATPASLQQTLPQLPPLKPGAVVTLTPLPDKALPTLLPAPTETLVTTTGAKTENQDALLAQKPQTNLITTLLQAVKSALPGTPALQPINTLIAGNDSPVKTSLPMSPQTPITTPAIPSSALNAKIVSMALPSGQVIALPDAPDLIGPQTGATPIGTTPASKTPASQPVATNTPASTLTITIAQVTPQNQPVLPIPINNSGQVQNFVLQAPPASVPIGTQITLQPQLVTVATPLAINATVTPSSTPSNLQMLPPQITTPVASLPPAWRSLLPLMQASSIWPAMDDIFQSFYQATPQAAQILGRTIPSPSNGANLGPSILLFAAALKAGDLQNWLGDKKLDMIQKLGKADLVSRLSRETASLSGNNDAPAAEWKSFPVPMLWQNEISKVLFHVRREPSEDNRENSEGGTRFVLDLSLSRMGDVQLDGMLQNKRLDLIVRTQTPVSLPMQDAMRKAYADALDGTDIYGELGFQGDIKQWMVIAREDGLSATTA
jgi:hypothetical protein